MNILPTPSGPLRPGSHRVQDGLHGAAAPDDAPRASETEPLAAAIAPDRAEISNAAIELSGRSEDANAIAELSSERLRTVLDRLSSGFYDREEVRREVMRIIAREQRLSGS